MKRIFILIACLVLSEKATARDLAPKYLDDVFTRVAEEEGVPVKLLRAICWAESRHEPEAYNQGDGKGNNHAFGICQVLHSTARGMGFSDPNCLKDFSDRTGKDGKLIRASRTAKDCQLFGSYTNIKYGAKYLKEKLDQYDGSWISAIAAYNAGSLRVCKTGFVTRAKDHSILWKCQRGHILNQVYVDRVLKALEEGR